MGLIQKPLKYVLKRSEVGLMGKVRAVTQDKYGNVVADTGWIENQQTDWAASAVAQWYAGVNNTGYNPVKPPNYMELGTGTGTPAHTDTALFTESPATNQQCSVVSASTNQATFVCQYYGTSTNAGTYTEAGLKDSDGHLFGHLMATISIQQGLSTTVTWVVAVSV